MLAIVLGAGVGYYLVHDDQKLKEHFLDLIVTITIAGLIGGRLWDVFFFDWNYYGTHLWAIPLVWKGGMAIQGGIVFGVAAAWWYCRKHGLTFWRVADLLAPAVIIGQGFGRIACLLNGDAFGRPTGSSFGLIYPPGTVAYATYGATPLWPAEVWEGQWDFVVFAIMLMLSRTRMPQGTKFLLYVILYSTGRFFLEFLRGDNAPVAFGLRSAQLTSLAAIILAALLIGWQYLQAKRVPQEQGM
jgi:phosphatidylglycerol:prolipoprotein diacylglycerol transferase